MMDVSLIIPTYRERDNIAHLFERIANALRGWEYELIVVDDDSPDGTAEYASSLAKYYPVKIVTRKGVRGLGSAILKGFELAEGRFVGVIDADLQHPPEVIPTLVNAVKNGSDIAVASRYVNGGGVDGWSPFRKIVSHGATSLARPLTAVKDPMSGCFVVKRSVIAATRDLNPNGFKLLLEILVKTPKAAVTEVPYTFEPRHNGASKLDRKEYARYLKLLLDLSLYKVTHWNHSG